MTAARAAQTARATLVGSGMTVRFRLQLARLLGSPLVTQSENTSVHVPFGSLPRNEFSLAVRESPNDTVAGSVFRPSDCQLPVNCPFPL